MTWKRNSACSVLSLLLFGTCDPAYQNTSIILTVTFTDDWLCAACADGILAYHDMNGQLLWSDSWSGNTTVEVISAEAVSEFPERIQVTTISEPNASGQTISIDTDIDTKPVNWLRRGFRPLEYQGDVTLSMQNVPSHSWYLVAGGRYGFSQSGPGPIPAELIVSVHAVPTDLYVRLDTDLDGPQYLLIPSAMPTENRAVDFDNLQPLISKTVPLPTNGLNLDLSLDTFDQSSPLEVYSGVHQIENQQNIDPSIGSFDFYYPAGIFSGYRTIIFTAEDEPSSANYWLSWVVADRPAAISLINADFTLVSTIVDNFEIEVTDSYTQTSSHWSYSDSEGHTFYWRVFSDLQQYTLPDLPPEFITRYPGVTKNHFTLISARVWQIGTLTWDEYMSAFFEEAVQYYNIVDETSYRSKAAP